MPHASSEADKKMRDQSLMALLDSLRSSLTPGRQMAVTTALRDEAKIAARWHLEVGQRELRSSIALDPQFQDREFRRGYVAGMRWLARRIPREVLEADFDVCHDGQIRRLGAAGISRRLARKISYQARAAAAWRWGELVSLPGEGPVSRRSEFSRDPFYVDGINYFLDFGADAEIFLSEAGIEIPESQRDLRRLLANLYEAAESFTRVE